MMPVNFKSNIGSGLLLFLVLLALLLCLALPALGQQEGTVDLSVEVSSSGGYQTADEALPPQSGGSQQGDFLFPDPQGAGLPGGADSGLPPDPSQSYAPLPDYVGDQNTLPMPQATIPAPNVDPNAPPPVPPTFGETTQPDPEPKTPEEAALQEEKNETFGKLDAWHSGVMANYVFNVTLMADPFMPIDSARAPTTTVEDPNIKKPMIQKLSLSQFSLQAIMGADGPDEIYALVESGGRGYILKRGTMIGPNNGYVREINDSTVVIAEPEVNFQGETTFKETVFRLDQLDDDGLESFEE
ncbi:MAG: hypothetical protein LBP92_00510 [Deltaproteobacteria bacterium]|jgi:Tfp pilus assembly protein PilP|nr:hypothetical protein [Deltaproteobacteria bacterium]